MASSALSLFRSGLLPITAVTVLSGFAISWTAQRSVKALETQHQELSQKLRSTALKLQGLRGVQTEQADALARAAATEQLAESLPRSVVLANIVEAFDSGTTLSSLEITNSTLLIDGQSTSDTQLAAARKMQALPELSNLTFEFAKNTDGDEAFGFHLKAQINGSGGTEEASQARLD